MIIDKEIINMTFSKKFFYFAVVFFSFAIISCSNPGNTPVIPIQTGTNGANPTSPTTPAQPESPATPTNPETPATTQPENPTTPTTPETPNTPTGGETTTTSPETPENGGATTTPESQEPQYKWIMTRLEMDLRSNSDDYTNNSSYSVDYTYSFYNSDFDCGNTNIAEINSTVIANGSTTTTSSNIKSVTTYSQSGNNITISTSNYTRENSTWVLSSESRNVYYKNVTLLSSSYTKSYPAGTESTTNYTIELLDNSNGIERYKVTYPSPINYYMVAEFINNKVQKTINYYTESNKKMSETDYIYSNNSILQANNIELALTQTKGFDSNEQLTTQTNQTLENVTLNANNTITVRLGSSTNTSTNYSYTTETFTRIQVPLTQQ